LIGDTRIHWVHLRFTGQGPVLEELKVIPVNAGVLDVSQVTTERWVLITDVDNRVWLWPLLAGSPHHLDLGAESVVSASWIGSRSALVVSAEGDERLIELAGWPLDAQLARLFQPIQYEGYSQASYVWQPSPSSANEVAKFNLVPLLSGTLEAALLALFLSIPVAIGSAIYVGFFLSSRRRAQIKPVIEVIASFPTVVLSGLAAVWLVPLVVNNLPQIVGAAILLPLAAFAAIGLPHNTRTSGDRWRRPFILCLVLAPAAAACLWMGVQLGNLAEHVWFDGSLSEWFFQRNIPVSQFNSVIVGIVLGIAVLPVVFSLAEDAINECPRAAALGSQALGASQWQSFQDVVLPVALPAIISAIMLGLGRAVGETMVFLMLSGNAPDLNLNPMDAVRNLGATLAIELPEAAVGDLHFRILFLAALILFAATFLVNTVAQVMRYRQRSKYQDPIG
jgi:phosphate transport system permease protein